MSMQRFYSGGLEALDDLSVGCIVSTSEVARDGHELVTGGISLDNYRRNPVWLLQHDQSQIVGTCVAIGINASGKLCARMRFPDPGISQLADQTRSLVKAGYLRAVSVGFEPLESEPLDPRRPKAGQRITRSELYECSFVAVPSDPNAVVTERFYGTKADMLAAVHALPAISAAAVQRAAAGIAGGRRASLIPHSHQVYLLLQANRDREAEQAKRHSYEQRQQDLRELGRYTNH